MILPRRSSFICGIRRTALALALTTCTYHATKIHAQTLVGTDCTNSPCTGISAGSISYINPNNLESISPAMPALSIMDPQAACSDDVSILLQVSYDGPQLAYWLNAYSTGGSWSTELVGQEEWNIDWYADLDTFSPIEGGAAQFYYSVNNGTYVPDVSFTIQGISPVMSDIVTDEVATNAPWFFNGTIPAESGGYQFYNNGHPSHYALGPLPAPYNTSRCTQYDSTLGKVVKGPSFYSYVEGGPVFGCPDGYGLTQLDGSPGNAPVTDQDLWDWTVNIADGAALAWTKQSTGYNKYATQYQKMHQYESSIGHSDLQPNTIMAGPCNFSWSGIGENGLGDASWITAYNGGTVYYWHNGLNGQNGYWNENPNHYVESVCSNL